MTYMFVNLLQNQEFLLQYDFALIADDFLKNFMASDYFYSPEQLFQYGVCFKYYIWKWSTNFSVHIERIKLRKKQKISSEALATLYKFESNIT